MSYEWSNGLTGVSPSFTLGTIATTPTSLTLTVTDNYGFTASDTVNIETFTALPTPPPELRDANSGGGLGALYLMVLGVCALYKRQIRR